VFELSPSEIDAAAILIDPTELNCVDGKFVIPGFPFKTPAVKVALISADAEALSCKTPLLVLNLLPDERFRLPPFPVIVTPVAAATLLPDPITTLRAVIESAPLLEVIPLPPSSLSAPPALTLTAFTALTCRAELVIEPLEEIETDNPDNDAAVELLPRLIVFAVELMLNDELIEASLLPPSIVNSPVLLMLKAALVVILALDNIVKAVGVEVLPDTMGSVLILRVPMLLN